MLIFEVVLGCNRFIMRNLGFVLFIKKPSKKLGQMISGFHSYTNPQFRGKHRADWLIFLPKPRLLLSL